MHRSLPFVLGATVLLCAAAPARAAEPFQCDASALRLTLATAPAVEPVTANRGAAQCAAQDAGGVLPAIPLPATGGALFAKTAFTGTDPLSEVATASTGLGDLSVGLPAAASEAVRSSGATRASRRSPCSVSSSPPPHRRSGR